MQKLPLSAYADYISLIPLTLANYPLAISILLGNNPGQVWVDNSNKPQSFIILSNSGYEQFIPLPAKTKVDPKVAIDICKTYQPMKIVWQPGWFDKAPWLAAGFRCIARQLFISRAVDVAYTAFLDAILNNIPDSYTFQPITAELLPKCQWRDVMLNFYGSLDNFIVKGLGYALLRNNEILSEAYSCFNGGTIIETGSVTQPAERGKGYATLIRAYLLKQCLNNNIQVMSSSNKNNPASGKISLKLGLQPLPDYKFLYFGQY